MLEAQALRVLWMSRYEEAWAHLQPGMRKMKTATDSDHDADRKQPSRLR
jgi:hypothetical protein